MLVDHHLPKFQTSTSNIYNNGHNFFRKLYMVGQTRIHIDTVKDLGHFMELEVVLAPEQTVEDGQKIASELQKKLGVQNEDLIDNAYVDMLLKE